MGSGCKKKWFTGEDTMKLINESEITPCQWNVSQKGYKNTYAKSWDTEKVASALDATVHKVDWNFHNLTCQYTSEFCKMIKNSRQGMSEQYTTQWPYLEKKINLNSTGTKQP
jgi:hypothetical protein